MKTLITIFLCVVAMQGIAQKSNEPKVKCPCLVDIMKIDSLGNFVPIKKPDSIIFINGDVGEFTPMVKFSIDNNGNITFPKKQKKSHGSPSLHSKRWRFSAEWHYPKDTCNSCVGDIISIYDPNKFKGTGTASTPFIWQKDTVKR